MYLHYSHKSTDQTGSRFQQERIAYEMALWLLVNYGDSANWVQCTQESLVTRCHRRKTYQTGSGLHTSMLQYSRRNNIIHRSADSCQHNAARNGIGQPKRDDHVSPCPSSIDPSWAVDPWHSSGIAWFCIVCWAQMVQFPSSLTQEARQFAESLMGRLDLPTEGVSEGKHSNQADSTRSDTQVSILEGSDQPQVVYLSDGFLSPKKCWIFVFKHTYICYRLLFQPLFQDKKAVKRSSDSQSNTMFASLVMKPICDFYDSVYMDLDRDRLQGMRKQIKAMVR